MTKISRKPLVLALALAFSPAVALGSVTENQLPGDGTATIGSATATINGSAMTVNLTGVSGSNNVTVIEWGNSGGTLNPNAATGGFNIGSQASVTFENGTSANDPFVLNVDTTGNPTEIAGKLAANGVNMAVANANGIVVDGTATINAPDGIGIFNQNFTSGALASLPNTASMILNYQGATGGITIATGATINTADVTYIVGDGTVNVDGTINGTAQGSDNSISIYSSDTVNINGPVTMDGYVYGSGNDETQPLLIAGQNININAPVTLNTPSGSFGDIVVSGFSPVAPSSGVLVSTLNISQTGGLIVNGNGNTTSSVEIRSAGYGEEGGNTSIDSLVNITDNGQISAPYGDVYLGGQAYQGTGSAVNVVGTQGLPAGTIYQAVGSVSGSGSITANYLYLMNQVGPINNNTSGQILANGFTLDAGVTGKAIIALADGASQPEGINLKVNGNAVIFNVDQNPSFTLSNGNSASINATPDAASRLIVQASGTMNVVASFPQFDTSNYDTITLNGTTAPVFTFPGLVYLLGNQGVTVNAAINSAYSTSTPQGFGVFLLGPTINDTYPIIANGDRGVNIESTSYGPTTINGVNVTQGDPNLPPVYFLNNGSSGLQLNQTSTFKNEWGYAQQNQVFFMSPSYQ